MIENKLRYRAKSELSKGTIDELFASALRKVTEMATILQAEERLAILDNTVQLLVGTGEYDEEQATDLCLGLNQDGLFSGKNRFSEKATAIKYGLLAFLATSSEDRAMEMLMNTHGFTDQKSARKGLDFIKKWYSTKQEGKKN